MAYEQSIESAMAKVKIEQIKATPVSQIEFILEKEKEVPESREEDEIT
jgi:hypothetical protein